MSLFIGNLSVRTRVDDLQRVFRKFGQCTLNLKACFGFVVYHFPQDAEKALRALQGRYICGQPIVLTWSKKQPLPFQGHRRVVRSYELHGRHSAKGRDFASRRMSSNDCRDHISDIKQPDTDGQKLSRVYILNEGRGDPKKFAKDGSREHHDLRESPSQFAKDDSGEHHDLREGLSVNDVTDVAKLVDTANQTDNDVEFDRYEPCQSPEGEYEHENRQMGYSGCGPVPQRPQENERTMKTSDTTFKRFKDLKSQNACFGCGVLGHKMCDCPKKYSSGRKSTGFGHRQDDDIGKTSRDGAELDRFGAISQENLRLNKDCASGHRKSKRASDLGKSRMLINNGRSPVTVSKETDRTEMKGRGGKKRSRWECESPKRNDAKKARSVSSPPHSKYPASKSSADSQLSKSVSRCSHSRARSKSVSMRRQLSSASRSIPKSISSKSSSRSSSLNSSAESLSQSLQKAHVDFKCPVYNSKPPQSKEILLEKRQPIGGDAQRVQNSGSDVAGCSSLEGSKGKIDPESSSGLVMVQTQLKEPASEMHANNCNGRSTCISSEEICMVLKHYGMELPEASERHLPIEEYFGCARLWPWEIVYYKRLKKGLVSVENYARRVSQNQEFGIVDKYVRSSSGWGELDQENP